MALTFRHSLSVASVAMAACLWAGTAAAVELTPKLAPEQVMTEAFARMKSGRWTSAAEAFDPEALARFRTILGSLLDAAEQAAARKDGDGSAEVMTVRLLFAPARTVEEIRGLSDAEIFARVMSSTLSLAGASLEQQQVIGSVAEGRDLVHVVVRNTAQVDKVAVSRVEAITLHRTAQGWRLALTGELEGLAESLQGSAGQDRPPQEQSSGQAGPGGEAR